MENFSRPQEAKSFGIHLDFVDLLEKIKFPNKAETTQKAHLSMTFKENHWWQSSAPTLDPSKT